MHVHCHSQRARASVCGRFAVSALCARSRPPKSLLKATHSSCLVGRGEASVQAHLWEVSENLPAPALRYVRERKSGCEHHELAQTYRVRRNLTTYPFLRKCFDLEAFYTSDGALINDPVASGQAPHAGSATVAVGTSCDEIAMQHSDFVGFVATAGEFGRWVWKHGRLDGMGCQTNRMGSLPGGLLLDLLPLSLAFTSMAPSRAAPYAHSCTIVYSDRCDLP